MYQNVGATLISFVAVFSGLAMGLFCFNFVVQALDLTALAIPSLF